MKEMKRINYMVAALLMVAVAACSDDNTTPEFAVDRDAITVEAVGGTETVHLTSGDAWVASTDAAWIAVSPANGRGTTPCKFQIDSALTAEPRRAVVRVENLNTFEKREIVVEQKGFPYTIEVEDTDVEVSNYDAYDKRYFEVKVRSNVDFSVKIPDNAMWLSNKSYSLNLNRGLRPREVTIRFEWGINTSPRERLAEVEFRPKSEVTLARQDALSVKQQAAAPIEEGTRAGDSVALLSISRSLNMFGGEWDASTPMSTWSGVQLWEEGMKGYKPENNGRVKYAEFMLFNIKEGLPFEVRYLTAAEELNFFGNTNTFLLNLSPGEYVTELTQLKRLTIGAYGLTELPASFKNLSNLEYLNLGSNNLQAIPNLLTKENFPKLRTLVLNANQRSVISDLSNTTRTDIGGLIDEPEFPTDLILWNLDTLVLSVNYLQGELPTFEEDDTIPVYTQADIDAVDTLPQYLVDNRIKKVLTNTKRFAINLNRLSGKLPDWLLYHPALDLWWPYSLVFPQEGRAKDGTQAIFSNEPVSLNYYYDIYTTKTRPAEEEEMLE